MKNIFIGIVLLGGMSLLTACSGDDSHTQYSVESVAPGPVTDITYTSAPGAVTLKYKMPTDPDLLYVKATYQLDNKKVKEAKASAYSNELLLEGFGKGDSVRKVTVVAVDANENESAPTIVDVVPQASPVFETIKTVSGAETYGGVKVKWTNPKDFNVIVVVSRENAVGEMEQLNGGKIYAEGTGLPDSRSIQGIDSIETNFTVHIEDRWGNRSSDYTFRAKPIFEVPIDKSTFVKWSPVNATGADVIHNQYWWGNDIPTIWDGRYAATYSWDNCYSTQGGGNSENKISFDMVSVVQPTRMKIWARKGYGFRAIGEYIRIWGSNDPQHSPTFNQSALPESHRWILLTEEQGPNGGFHTYKPSGLPGTQATSADIQYAEYEGFDIDFKRNLPPVHYICIEMVSNWDRNYSPNNFTIAEVAFWGKYIRK